MKRSIRTLKARLETAGAALDDRPYCERCRCPRCARNRAMTSGEKREAFGQALAKSLKILIGIGPDGRSEILNELTRAGLKLVRIDSAEGGTP